jgi:hypothetical protein
MVYPGTNIEKEVMKYYTMLWKVVVPVKRVRLKAVPGPGPFKLMPAGGHPSFYAISPPCPPKCDCL